MLPHRLALHVSNTEGLDFRWFLDGMDWGQILAEGWGSLFKPGCLVWHACHVFSLQRGWDMYLTQF